MTDLSNISRPQASTQADIDDITAAFDRRFKRMGGDQFNGSTKYVTAMLTLISALMVAGIVGGISMYANVAALTQKIEATNAKVDLIIAGRIK